MVAWKLSWMPALAAAAALAGCGGRERPMPPGVNPAPAWRAAATRADRARLRGWRDSFMQARAEAAGAGFARQLADRSPLLDADAALHDAAPPPGAYRCRMTKLGAQRPGGLAYVAYPLFRCRIAVDAGGLRLTKLDGSQRPEGRLLPHDARRLIFLGTMMLGDERRALDYGQDAERDMAGLFERIGPARWRLVLPAPRWESKLDILELVPG